MFYLSGAGLPRLSWEKKPLNGYSTSSSSSSSSSRSRSRSNSRSSSSSRNSRSRVQHILTLFYGISKDAEERYTRKCATTLLQIGIKPIPRISLLPACQTKCRRADRILINRKGLYSRSHQPLRLLTVSNECLLFLHVAVSVSLFCFQKQRSIFLL